MLHTTFALAKQHLACAEGYASVAKALGGVKHYGKNTPIPLSVVATMGRGLDDALWCLRAVLPSEELARDRISRLLACDYAEHVLPKMEARFPDDKQPRQYVEALRRFASGDATLAELDLAAEAAEAAWATGTAEAARRATWAAWEAAGPAEAAWTAAVETEERWQLERFLAVMAEIPELEGRGSGQPTRGVVQS